MVSKLKEQVSKLPLGKCIDFSRKHRSTVSNQAVCRVKSHLDLELSSGQLKNRILLLEALFSQYLTDSTSFFFSPNHYLILSFTRKERGGIPGESGLMCCFMTAETDLLQTEMQLTGLNLGEHVWQTLSPRQGGV